MIHDRILCIDVHDGNNDLDVILFYLIDVYSIYLYFPIIIYYIYKQMTQYQLPSAQWIKFIFVCKLLGEDLESEWMNNQHQTYLQFNISFALYFHVIKAIRCEDFYYQVSDLVNETWIYFYIIIALLLVYYVDIDKVQLYYILCSLLIMLLLILLIYIILSSNGSSFGLIIFKEGRYLQWGPISYSCLVHAMVDSYIIYTRSYLSKC